MKVIVPVKRVIDANIKVRVKADRSGVELNNVKMAMNPFCEIAVEESIRMRESGAAEEIIVVAAGPQQSGDTIRTALAMGADRGILIQTDVPLEPLAISKLLKAVVDRENPGIVLMGKQAVDNDNNQTGQMLSAMLGWSLGTFVSKIEIQDSGFQVVREVDGGLETIMLSRPAVITVDLRLNEPRYASLPNIMKARKKPIEALTPEDLGVDVTPRVNVLEVNEPPARQAGVRVESAAELIEKLTNGSKGLVMSILILVEHDNQEVKSSTLNTVTAARQLGDDVHALVVGFNCDQVVTTSAKIEGINKVLKIDSIEYEYGLVENTASVVENIAKSYSHVLAPASTFGKNLMPRVAAMLDVQQISDISEIVSEDTFIRPIYAGNALATVQSTDSIKLITVRTTTFDPAAEEGGVAEVEELVSFG